MTIVAYKDGIMASDSVAFRRVGRFPRYIEKIQIRLFLLIQIIMQSVLDAKWLLEQCSQVHPQNKQLLYVSNITLIVQVK